MCRVVGASAGPKRSGEPQGVRRAWLRSSLRVVRGVRSGHRAGPRVAGINQEDGRAAWRGQAIRRSRAARGQACSRRLPLPGLPAGRGPVHRMLAEHARIVHECPEPGQVWPGWLGGWGCPG